MARLLFRITSALTLNLRPVAFFLCTELISPSLPHGPARRAQMPVWFVCSLTSQPRHLAAGGRNVRWMVWTPTRCMSVMPFFSSFLYRARWFLFLQFFFTAPYFWFGWMMVTGCLPLVLAVWWGGGGLRCFFVVLSFSAWKAYQLLGSWYSEHILWQIVAGYSSINVTHDETILFYGGVMCFFFYLFFHCKQH